MVLCAVVLFILLTTGFTSAPAQVLQESGASVDGFDVGVLLNETVPNTRATTASGVCDGTKQIVCDSCTTLRVCLGPSQTVLCPTDQPYCIHGTTSDSCSNVPIADICDEDMRNSAVICSAVGKFPDASNCHIYHICANVGDTSSVYACPVGYVFNEAVQLCAKENVFSRCITLQCSANFVGNVRYGLSKRYFGFCAGSGQKPIMFQCPIGATFNFITGSTFGECVYRCPRSGNFPNSNDPATYFQCFWFNRRLLFNLVRCVDGKNYNPTLGYCV